MLNMIINIFNNRIMISYIYIYKYILFIFYHNIIIIIINFAKVYVWDYQSLIT